ncbi:MAG: DUF1080 domain-containing protein [Planctomycetes bacterium]|nr:DUF1080 domain-containing protein [Planctomycetota bacterium]
MPNLFTSVALLVLGLSSCTSLASKGAPRSLFDGKTLNGWQADVPTHDADPNLGPSFAARDGMLVSLGAPHGHLITDAEFSNYRLVVEYRWAGSPGNCGVLVHVSKPRRLYDMFPQSIECQMHAGNAGDFWCIGEDIAVPDMEARRGPKSEWGVDGDKKRRIKNLTDGSESQPGDWNQMVIECKGRSIDVWVNGDHVNSGTDCTADRGRIALQAEGAVVEFRKLELSKLD